MKILREEDIIPMTLSYNAMTSSVFADDEFRPAFKNKISEAKRKAESMAPCIESCTNTFKSVFDAPAMFACSDAEAFETSSPALFACSVLLVVVVFTTDRNEVEKKLKNTSLKGGAKLDSNDTEVLSPSLLDDKMASSIIFSPNKRTSSLVKLPLSLAVKFSLDAARCNRLEISD